MGKTSGIWISVILMLTLLSFPVVSTAFQTEVMPFSGALRIERNDLVFDGNLQPLLLKRIYRSDASAGDVFGPGWSHNYQYNAYFREHKDDILVFGPENTVWQFRKTSDSKQKKNSPLLYTAMGGTFSAKKVGMSLEASMGENSWFYFGKRGELIRQKDDKGRFILLNYENRKLKTVSGFFKQNIMLEYDDSGLIVRSENSLGTEIGYQYDGSGRLTEIRVKDRVVEGYRYDKKGRLGMITDHEGRQWKIAYYKNGKVARITEPSGYATRYSYKETDVSREFITIAPNGGKTVTRYRKNGSGMETVDPEGGVTSVNTDPETGSVSERTDANGNKTSYTRDKLGRIVKISAPEDQVTTFKYKKQNRFPSKIKESDGNTIEIVYDDNNNPVSIENERYGNQKYAYDKEGRMTLYVKYDGTERHFTYNNGWIPSEIKETGGSAVSVVFDDKGNPVSVDSGDSRISINTYYSALEELDKAIRPVFDFSSAGKTIRTDDGKTRFVFDAMGNITQVTYPTGGEKKMSYDMNGRLKEMVWPDTNHEKRTRYPDGSLKTRTFKEGTLTYLYDGLNRLKRITGPDGETTEYSRNAAGKPETVLHNRITRNMEYDSAGRMVFSEYEPDDENQLKATSLTKIKVGYKHLKDGGYIREVNTDDETSRFQYDKYNVLKSIDSEVFGTFKFVTEAGGKPKEIFYPNGTVEIWSEEQGTIIHTVKKDKKILYSEVLSINSAGLTRKATVNGKSQEFIYDSMGQIKKASVEGEPEEYYYDSWGNRTRTGKKGKIITGSYTKCGQVSSYGKLKQTWDSRGNLLTSTSPEKTVTFGYSIRGRLNTIADSTGNSVTYRYDENGLMISREHLGKSTWIVNDGTEPVLELEKYSPDDNKERVVRRFLTGDHVGELFAMSRLEEVTVKDKIKTIEVVYYIHRDRRGNVVLVTDSSGNTVSSYTYAPFGNIVKREGKWDPPFLFGAHRLEPEFNLYYMKARFYDPETGRFISPDPETGVLEDALSTNPYLYVKNSPMDYNDPLGMKPEKLLKTKKSPPKPKSWGDYALDTQIKIMPAVIEATAYDTLVNMGTDAIAGQKVSDTLFGYTTTNRVNFGKATKMLEMKKNPVTGVYETIKKPLKIKGKYSYTVKRPKPGADKLSNTLGHAYNAGKLVLAYTDIKSRQEAGLLTEAEANDALKGEFVSTAGGVVVDVLKTGMNVGTISGVGLTLVTNWTSENYKELLKESGKVGRAKANMVERKIVGDNTNFVLARRKMTAIKSLINRGDEASLKEARRLNSILSDYTENYAKKEKIMDKMYWMTFDLDTKITDKLTAISKKKTETFNKTMAERKKVLDDFQKHGPYGKQDSGNNDDTGSGGIIFEDVDSSKAMMVKSSIDRERRSDNLRSDTAIKAESDHITRVKHEQIKAMAEGLQTVGVGLQTAYNQSKAYDAQHKARVDAQNARMKSVVNDYSNAQAAKKQAFADKYGDPLAREAYAANGKPIPSHMLPKDKQTASYTPKTSTGKPASGPVTPTYTGGSASSGTGKGPVRTKLRHYKVYSKVQMTRKDGIPVSPGDWLGGFDALIGHGYGSYSVKKTTGSGTTMYIPSSQNATHGRVKQWLKDGKVTVKYTTEEVVLVDGKVIPADVYAKSNKKMNAIKNELKKKGIKTGTTTWQ